MRDSDKKCFRMNETQKLNIINYLDVSDIIIKGIILQYVLVYVLIIAI